MFQETGFKKTLMIVFLIIILCPVYTGESQIFLSESFETGTRPEGWTEQFISGTEPWRFRNGGHSPNDNNWLVPASQKDIARNPPAAFDGTFNAIFFKQGDGNERTMLISPAMNLLGGANNELSFYLCQIPWTFEGSVGWDVLRVYYKVSEESPWVLLHEYLDPVYSWQKQTLMLPDPSSTYYLGFEGQTRWGYGACIDKILVESKGLKQYWISDIGFYQPFIKPVPSGTSNVPMMRIDFTVLGNSGSAVLEKIKFVSMNSADSDVNQDGVKLYSTTSQTFSTSVQLGSPGNLVSGIADFQNLNYVLPPGKSYLWLTFDVNSNAAFGDILDIKVEGNGILANDTLYPALENSPDGFRIVHTTQYFENFESLHNWSLGGEFEVGAPSGDGGSPGNPDPLNAYSGNKILGTDLTGLGANLYDYEPGIGEADRYEAISPPINLLYYKNLSVFFSQYLNIEVWDNASVQVSTDNGGTWNTIWKNNSYVNDFVWTQQQVPVPDAYSRTGTMKLKYVLGPTDVQNNYSGWNIDDIYITGEFISRDAGISEWIYPQSGGGHTANDSVTVRVNNYGGLVITDPVPVMYSFNNGLTWITDILDQDIPVGGSVLFTFPTRVDLSAPGARQALVKTGFPGDQYPVNDQKSVTVYIVPTFKPPYYENFEKNDGYWRESGTKMWEYGTPGGNVIDGSFSGDRSWVTGLVQSYGDIITRKHSIIFQDDFEFDLGWIFTGEFERGIPDYDFIPFFAASGYFCAGTDLSGWGVAAYKYENGITPASAFNAVSPAFDVRKYSNLTVGFSSWMTVMSGDSLRFEVSPDGGSTWQVIWENNGAAIYDEGFSFHEFLLPESLNTSAALRFRFSLYYTSSSGPVAQGVSVDDFIFTGNLLNLDPSYLISPVFDLTGVKSPAFEAKMWIDTETNVDGTTLEYSTDNGLTWTPASQVSAYDSYWNWYSGNQVTSLMSDGWSGQSNGWINVRCLLPAELINQKMVQFRFRFNADKVNNSYDGTGIDDVHIFEAPFDLGVVDVISPVSACELSDNQKFSLVLKNYGINSLQPGDSVKIGFVINRNGDIQKAEERLILQQPFLPGTTMNVDMNSEFNVSIAGQYNVEIFTIEQDPLFYYPVANDSLARQINVNKPPVDLGPDITTSRPDQVLLKAYSDARGNSYLWNDGSVDSVYHVTSAGKYYVRVNNVNGCTASDTINIAGLTIDAGVSDLLTPLNSCLPSAIETISINIVNFGTDTLEINDQFPTHLEINSVIFTDTCKLKERLFPGDTLVYSFNSSHDFSTPGIYKMKLYTSLPWDSNNQNDTLNIIFEAFEVPSVDLGDDIVISSSEYTLSAPGGYSDYLWQDGTRTGTYVATMPGSHIYHVTVTNEKNCSVRDSINVTLNISDISISRILSPVSGCSASDTLSVSLRVENTGNLPLSPGQSIVINYAITGLSSGAGSFALSESLMPGDSIDFTFIHQISIVRSRLYELNVEIYNNSDMRLPGNKVNQMFLIYASPVVNLGEDFRVITDVEYVLDAGQGYSSYLWHDGSTDRTYTLNSPGINTCSVRVTDSNGCSSYDKKNIMLAVPDLSISGIINPTNSCSSEKAEQVKVAISNSGTWDIAQNSIIHVSYSINGSAPVTGSIETEALFEKGSVIYYTFNTVEDYKIPGNYEISVWVKHASDLLSLNDTMKASFKILESPYVNISEIDTILTLNPLTLQAPMGYQSYKWQNGSLAPSFEITEPGASMAKVVVTGTNGCSAADSVYVIFDIPDVGINSIVMPESCLSAMGRNEISFEVINKGFISVPVGTGIVASYSINKGPSIMEIVSPSVAIEPGKTGILKFSTPYDPNEASFTLDIKIEKSDIDLSNNIISGNIILRNTPPVDLGAGKDTLFYSVLPFSLDAGRGFASYKWQDGSDGEKFTATEEGLYWVSVSDINGCSDTDTVYVSLTDKEQSSFPGTVSIYPNPVSDFLNLLIDLDERRDIRIDLMNLGGKINYIEDFRDIMTLDKKIDVTSMAPGLYFVRITSGKSQFISRIIVY